MKNRFGHKYITPQEGTSYRVRIGGLVCRCFWIEVATGQAFWE